MRDNVEGVEKAGKSNGGIKMDMVLRAIAVIYLIIFDSGGFEMRFEVLCCIHLFFRLGKKGYQSNNLPIADVLSI